MNSSINDLTEKIKIFCKARNWSQFHNPKDLAISLNLEASELLEHFQWKNGDELQEYIKKNKKEIGNELSDVLYWILLMSHELDTDLERAFLSKMKENAKKYPVKKAKGKALKYDKL